MESELKRSIILEHYQRPFNKGLVKDEKGEYVKLNVNNELCVDNLDMMIKVEEGIIKDIKFEGEACAISTSATSIITKTLIGKTVSEAYDYINEYEKMIDEKPFDTNKLGEAVVYDEIYKQPNRKKCALLPVEGIKKLLQNLK